MSEYVFVYGTLKRGELNERLMEGSEYVADGMVTNAGLLNMPGFPGLLLGRCPEELYAQGEVYEIYHSYVLDTLDALESEGRMYKRIKVPVELDRTFPTMLPKSLVCWTYVLLMDLPPDRLVRRQLAHWR